MLSPSLLYDEAINCISLSLLNLSLPLSCNRLFPLTLLPSLSVSSHLFLSFHLMPFPPFSHSLVQ